MAYSTVVAPRSGSTGRSSGRGPVVLPVHRETERPGAAVEGVAFARGARR